MWPCGWFNAWRGCVPAHPENCTYTHTIFAFWPTWFFLVCILSPNSLHLNPNYHSYDRDVNGYPWMQIVWYLCPFRWINKKGQTQGRKVWSSSPTTWPCRWCCFSFTKLRYNLITCFSSPSFVFVLFFFLQFFHFRY